MDNNGVPTKNALELRKALDEHLMTPCEFFTQGACWAFAFALGSRCATMAYELDDPRHVWIEHAGRAYDARCGGVPQRELLRRFFDGPYAPEKARVESARLSAACHIRELSDL